MTVYLSTPKNIKQKVVFLYDVLNFFLGDKIEKMSAFSVKKLNEQLKNHVVFFGILNCFETVEISSGVERAKLYMGQLHDVLVKLKFEFDINIYFSKENSMVTLRVTN